MVSKKKKRLQKLGPIDEHVRALLDFGIPEMLLAWDAELCVYLVATLCEESDEPPFDQKDWVEYQVSDGLPGDRSFSNDFYTFEEANKNFEKVCKEAKREIDEVGTGTSG